jgi:hypothetical protein
LTNDNFLRAAKLMITPNIILSRYSRVLKTTCEEMPKIVFYANFLALIYIFSQLVVFPRALHEKKSIGTSLKSKNFFVQFRYFIKDKEDKRSIIFYLFTLLSFTF